MDFMKCLGFSEDLFCFAKESMIKNQPCMRQKGCSQGSQGLWTLSLLILNEKGMSFLRCQSVWMRRRSPLASRWNSDILFIHTCSHSLSFSELYELSPANLHSTIPPNFFKHHLLLMEIVQNKFIEIQKNIYFGIIPFQLVGNVGEELTAPKLFGLSIYNRAW